MTKYALDTNILINFEIFTPDQYHKNFWKELSRKVEQGQIVIIEDIANECRRGFVKKWVGSLRKAKHITELDDRTRQAAIKINSQYKLTQSGASGRIKSQADAPLIAYARAHNLVVFTYEQKKRNPNDPNKIPDVCDQLAIKWMRWPKKVMGTLAFKDCGEA